MGGVVGPAPLTGTLGRLLTIANSLERPPKLPYLPSSTCSGLPPDGPELHDARRL